jgi:hypothetical protein
MSYNTERYKKDEDIYVDVDGMRRKVEKDPKNKEEWKQSYELLSVWFCGTRNLDDCDTGTMIGTHYAITSLIGGELHE